MRPFGAMFFAVACAPEAPVLTARAAHDHVLVESSVPVDRALLLGPDGAPLVSRRLPAPLTTLRLDWRAPGPGRYTARVWADGASFDTILEVSEPSRPFSLSLEAPVGQGALTLGDTAPLPVVLVDGAPTQVALTLTAREAGDARLSLGERHAARALSPGERLVLLTTLDGPAELVASLGAVSQELLLTTRAVPLDTLRGQLSVGAPRFPAELNGAAELARPAGRVTLPSVWWRGVQRALGLGVRPQDSGAPWSYQAIPITNHGDEAVNLSLSARVVGPDGAPAAPFRPDNRGGESPNGAVTALLRVPAGGEAIAVLPMWVDEALLRQEEGRPYTRRVEVSALGQATPLAVIESPLHVSFGSATASLGLLVGLVSAALGMRQLKREGPAWLGEPPTSTLLTISLFAAVAFLFNAASLLIGVGVSAVLGPFSPLLTGLIDGAARAAMLATLLTLHPRPGVAGLYLLTQALLSAFTFGRIGLIELLFVAKRVFWVELFLRAFGLTTRPSWRDESRLRRWARLAGALCCAEVVSEATSLMLSVALYRLFLADWYVGMMLLGPALGYTALACALAVPFAESLRRIQR
jgi:hypothetical protein